MLLHSIVMIIGTISIISIHIIINWDHGGILLYHHHCLLWRRLRLWWLSIFWKCCHHELHNLVQIKDCAEVATAAKMEAMMKDKKFQKKYGACFENECYSEEDMEAMTKMMEMMAGMQCWDRAFTKACTGHIKENLMNMASNMLNGKWTIHCFLLSEIYWIYVKI